MEDKDILHHGKITAVAPKVPFFYYIYCITVPYSVRLAKGDRRQTLAVSVRVRALGRPTLAHLLRPRSHDLFAEGDDLFADRPAHPTLAVLARDRREL